MADTSVAGPFGKGDFAEDFWFDPVHGAPFSSAHAFCLVARQDRLGGFDFAQALSQFARALHREASAHLPGVAQGAVFLVRKIQRSERASTALCAAIANDD